MGTNNNGKANTTVPNQAGNPTNTAPPAGGAGIPGASPAPTLPPFSAESIRTSITDVLFVNGFFLLVWMFHNRMDTTDKKKRFHLKLDVFLRYSALFVTLNVILKIYHPTLSRTFVASGIYHSAYLMHSLIAVR